MSEQYPGGFITKSPPTPQGPYQTDSAYGMWNLSQQAAYKAQGLWPTAGNLPVDAQFNYVTMLLHGDGTNGAQNNTFLDSSASPLTITRNGNTTQGSFSPYGSNWSNYFSYNSTATNYLSATSISLSGNFTCEGYVYWDGIGNNPVMFTIGDSFNSTGIEIYRGGGNWIVYSGDAIKITGSAAVAGQWTYIAVTRTGSTITMYINGVSQGTWTSSATFSGTIRVGAEYYSSTFYSSMSGYISNFRINNTTAINTVPTAPLTAVSGTVLLTCQSNRFVDNSASPLTITVSGSPSVQRFNPFGTSTAYSTATIGGSGYFDGNADYLSIANNTAFDMGSGDYTIEGWMYQTSSSGMQSICAKYEPSYQASWIVGTSGANWDVYVYYGSTSYVTVYTGAAPALNQWNHFALERNGSNIEFYVNGARVAQVGAQTMRTTTSAVAIGRTGSGYTEYFVGDISDIRIRKGTATYSGATYTVPTAPLTAVSNTVLLCNFTNAAIYDNAMMNDLETVGNAQISTSVVKYGTGSLAFDGTGDYLTFPSTPNCSFGSGDFTVEAWIYASSTAGPSQIIVLGDNDQFFFRFESAQLAYSFNNGSVFSSTTCLTTNTWIHVAITRASGTVRMFAAGTQVYSATDTTTMTAPTGNSSIGAKPGGSQTYTGYIDDLRITKGYARYTTTFTPPTAAFYNTGPN